VLKIDGLKPRAIYGKYLRERNGKMVLRKMETSEQLAVAVSNNPS
jgi:hypothetical protein